MIHGKLALAAVAAWLVLQVGQAAAYTPITPSAANRTVTLTGKDLSVEQLVDIARYGAKVRLSPEAATRAKDTYGLFLEAAAEGVQVYLFNRGGGVGRENSTFKGDPLSPENKARLEANMLRAFQNGARGGEGPEVEDEEAVRAMMAVRANTITYDAPSPQLMQALLDLLNNRITPVVRSAHGTVGEADITLMTNVAATMVGRGEAYYNGQRMSAADALQRAGLKPIQPFAADNTALTSTNAYTASQAALLVDQAERTLQWADVVYGMDLLGMNSSITPLSRPTQINRPEPWLNWHAARMLEMLKGSYLFEVDPKRIIQDPDSLRASSIRQGSAWRAWAELRDATLFQINSSDHNPTIRVGLKPTDSWELSTPMMMQYYVKGGPHSDGKSGYVVSTANWDPYPLSNRVEAFTLALANVDVAVVERFYRLSQPFHAGVKASDVLNAQEAAGAAPQGNGTSIVAYWGEVEREMAPVPPVGVTSDAESNGDIESQLPLKLAKARMVADASLHILAHDMMTAAYWLDVRRIQDPKRGLGQGAAAAWAAYRKVSPWGVAAADRPERSAADMAYGFMTSQSPAAFLPASIALPK